MTIASAGSGACFSYKHLIRYGVMISETLKTFGGGYNDSED